MSNEIVQYKDVTPFQKLDGALNLLAEIEEGNIYKSPIMLLETIQLGEMEIVFNKLIKDGFADKKPSTETDIIRRLADAKYYITFDGKLFHQQGGYAAQFASDELRKWKEEKLMNTTIDANVSSHSINRLFWATLAVALAGAIAPWLDYFREKRLDDAKERIKTEQVQQQQNPPQLFYNPARP